MSQERRQAEAGYQAVLDRLFGGWHVGARGTKVWWYKDGLVSGARHTEPMTDAERRIVERHGGVRK